MHKTNLVTLISILIMLQFCSDVLAQRGINRKGGGGQGRSSEYGRMYNANTVETLSGTVTNVERITPTRGRSCGIHLTIKTEDENICVHLGPAWFIDSLDLAIVDNDTLEIKGSRITFEGNPVIIAAIVEKGGQTLTLRDEIGVPVWSGWRQRR
jgi:hypothetical protein